MAKRPKRTPISGHRNILTVSGIPDGYVGRWVNDVDENVNRFLAAGYEFVTDKNLTIGDRTIDGSDSVGSIVTKNVGNGVVSYLMAQPKEYYEEDKAAAHEVINKRQAAMTRKGEGQYGSVKIETG